VLADAWTRRALRNLTRDTPPAELPALLQRMSIADARALRDADWAAREASYHAAGVAELNALVRKYNGLAPYAVRRAYYDVGAELERAYEAAGEEIVRGLEERVSGQRFVPQAAYGVKVEQGEEGGVPVSVMRVRDVIRGWVRRWTGG
jgi:DnaJ family protein C protein 28